jgi:hypothetical protein
LYLRRGRPNGTALFIHPCRTLAMSSPEKFTVKLRSAHEEVVALTVVSSSSFGLRILSHINQTTKTNMVKGIVTASKTHHFFDTCNSVSPKSKNVVLKIAEMNVPGKKSIVIAAIVIIEAESR